MGFQTAYALVPAVAVPGELGDSGFTDKITGIVANATLAVGLLAVFHAGDGDQQVRAPAATGEVTGANVRGIGIYEPNAQNAPRAVGDMISLLKRGRIWVNVEEAITPLSPVFVRFAAGSFPTLGAFRASADTASAVALPGAKYLSTQATIGGLALVEVNFP